MIHHAAFAIALFLPGAVAAQQPPPVRPIGPITAVTRDSLASIAQAVQLSAGRVYVNDIRAKRVIMFDSTLSRAVIVADSTGTTANAYGDRAGSLLVYRGDSAVLISPASLSMQVLTPGKGIVRTLAMPSGRGMANGLMGSVFGTPGFDAKARLTQYMPVFNTGPRDLTPGTVAEAPDSAVIVRTDLATRGVDTAGYYRIPKDRAVVNPQGQAGFRRTTLNDNAGNRVVFGATSFPPQTVDDWAVMADGSLAIVRGRDYHVDWLGPDGRWTSTPKMPFTWTRTSDERKQFLLDSVVTSHQEMLDSMVSRRERMLASGASPGCGRGGCSAEPAGTPPKMERPIALKALVTDVPDYEPPFGQGAVRGDADNHLWIQTSVQVDGRPVYDIVNRKGEVVDRVQLPRFRTIAGFGPGVVYMAVIDSANVVHLEKARLK